MFNKMFTFGLLILSLLGTALPAAAEPALYVLGKDYVFPQHIQGMPEKLSDFKDLQINSFTTDDHVRIDYWEAGTGEPLIFVPGWSANGAEYINIMYLLRKHNHVYVMDPRNQGLSQTVPYGLRISRSAMDLKEMTDHLGIKSANFCGWSMGSSVLWSYIDLFGTASIRKAAFIDEPPAIVASADWTAEERRNAGSMTDSADQLVKSFSSGEPSPLMDRFKAMDSPYYVNSESFARSFIHSDMKDMLPVLREHGNNDWRDVIAQKIDVPTIIFTGDYSLNVPSQRWMHSVISNSTLLIYTKEQQGDHFLAFKNPVKFTQDLTAFLSR